MTNAICQGVTIAVAWMAKIVAFFGIIAQTFLTIAEIVGTAATGRASFRLRRARSMTMLPAAIARITDSAEAAFGWQADRWTGAGQQPARLTVMMSRKAMDIEKVEAHDKGRSGQPFPT